MFWRSGGVGHAGVHVGSHISSDLKLLFQFHFLPPKLLTNLHMNNKGFETSQFLPYGKLAKFFLFQDLAH
jgi:hypothetical protein